MAVIRVENKKMKMRSGPKVTILYMETIAGTASGVKAAMTGSLAALATTFCLGGPVATLSQAEQISTGSFLIRLPTKRASMSLRITIRNMTRFS